MLPDWWIKSFGEKPYAITDCVEAMKKVPDKAVDLVLTDLPYAIDVDYGETYKDSKENLKNLIKNVIPEITRIAKYSMVFPGIGNMFLYPPPNWVDCWTYWPGDTMCQGGFNCWQPILCYGTDPYLKNGLGSRMDTIRWRGNSEKNLHPCPKPIKLIQWCVERGTIKEGAIVLDPFLGSGTTIAACNLTNRIGLGFEINPKYEAVIKETINNKRIALCDYE
jgi:DNA modification methylase